MNAVLAGSVPKQKGFIKACISNGLFAAPLQQSVKSLNRLGQMTQRLAATPLLARRSADAMMRAIFDRSD